VALAAGAPHHQVEVGRQAAEQVAFDRRIAVEGEGPVRGVERVVEAGRLQAHTVALEQHDRAVHPAKDREGAAHRDGGDAHAPVEVVQAGAGRKANDLLRGAPAVLPRRRGQG
jgi:hypothetical protein